MYKIPDRERFKYPFSWINDVPGSYSQSYQDLFVACMTDGKRWGSFLEIGCGHPFLNNNTYLLETFLCYRGVSVDLQDYKEWQWREGTYKLTQDAATVDYNSVLHVGNWPDQIDYLQIDIDSPLTQLNIVKKLLRTKYRFSVITYETDFYTGYNEHTSNAHQLLTENDYELVVRNVGCVNQIREQDTYGQLVPYENWYVDKRVVSKDLINRFINVNKDVLEYSDIFLLDSLD